MSGVWVKLLCMVQGLVAGRVSGGKTMRNSVTTDV